MTTLPVHRLQELPMTISRYLTEPARHRVLLLYTTVRTDITSGALPPGRILTYPDLESRFRPRMTTREVSGALWLLREDGLVETKVGLGTRVRVEGQEWTRPEAGLTQVVHIEKALRTRLADGIYPVGAPWPARRALAAEFGVSVTTIHKAQAPLFMNGYLASASPHRRAGAQVTDLVARTPREVLLRPSGPSFPRGTAPTA